MTQASGPLGAICSFFLGKRKAIRLYSQKVGQDIEYRFLKSFCLKPFFFNQYTVAVKTLRIPITVNSSIN